MENQLQQMIDESIKVELNMAALYQIYSDIFPEDTAFWEKLCHEEKNHAVIIKAARDVLFEFPEELLPSTFEELLETNKKLKSLIKKYKEKPPSREEAYRMALILEESAGEVHFQRAMDGRPVSKAIAILKDLNNGAKDHANRILDHIKQALN